MTLRIEHQVRMAFFKDKSENQNEVISDYIFFLVRTSLIL
jgi:hypothetical protein